jgi:muconolactone D-isomerase
MQFKVEIVVKIPGDWTQEQIMGIYAAEMIRGHELRQAGRILRIWRVVGQRANVGIWQADTLEELHDSLSSLPLYPYMEVSVTALIDHPSTPDYIEKFGELPAI